MGPSAGTAKRRKVCCTPIAQAAVPTSSRYGKVQRVSDSVRASLAGSLAKPGANRPVRGPAAAIPARVRKASTSSAAAPTAAAARTVASSPSVVFVSVSTGTKAAEAAPSATTRRIRFGMRKATKNASAPGPVPNTALTAASRASPATRDPAVITARTWAARETLRLSSI